MGCSGDLRTNMRFTLKTSSLQRSDLDEFVKNYNPENRHQRKTTWTEKKPDGRWRSYTYDELVSVGRTNNLHQRPQFHTRNNHNQATFAFLQVRKATGMTKPSYKAAGSRSGLSSQRDFRSAFEKARQAIREMDIRFIEEKNPRRQELIEICTAMRFKATFNDFDNH